MKRVILLSDSDTDQASSDVRFDYLSPQDWQRLNEHDCISDKVITRYLELLRSCVLEAVKMTVCVLSNFFTTKMLATGYSGVESWYSKVNFCDAEFVLAIFNEGNHWTMMVIRPSETS
ncbi:sentrin-specific protease 1-like [Dysidea avara]|uniref:sentrin-specific protease 1-like n=1 Tax=Dysidea avara TaxID=196820 RepID=UPI0033299EA6